MTIAKILVPVDFSPASDAALAFALRIADQCGAEVQVLHVWQPLPGSAGAPIFAETQNGVAMERRLSAAESDRPTRVSGRLEFGDDPSRVILSILERERFDLVVMGFDGETEKEERQPGHVTKHVAKTAPCKVVALHRDGEHRAA